MHCGLFSRHRSSPACFRIPCNSHDFCKVNPEFAEMADVEGLKAIILELTLNCPLDVLENCNYPRRILLRLKVLSCVLWFVLSNSDCLVLLLPREINLVFGLILERGPQPLAIILEFGQVADGSGWSFFRFSFVVLGAFKAQIQSISRLGPWPAFFFPGGSISLALAQPCLLSA